MLLRFAATTVAFISLLPVIVRRCHALPTPANDPLPGGFDQYPSSLTLRAGVIEDHPFSFIDEHPNGTYSFSGFEIDFLERIKAYAAEDGVNLTFILAPAPSKYNEALNLVANDCNTSANPNSWEDCEKFDLIVGDYFSNPTRFARVDFTPTWLTATMTSVKFLDKGPGVEDYSTIDEVEKGGATMCLLDGTYVTRTILSLWPKLKVQFCHKQLDCFAYVKNQTCALWADDSTQLSYRVSLDPSLALSPQSFKPQFFAWPMKFELDDVVRYLIKRWTYMGTSTGELADLYHEYFEAKICPVGTAGLDCELPCDPDYGRSDKRGRCVCVSTKWTGDDCSVEVMENKNLIPSSLLITGYVMFGINAFACVGCAIWLYWKRKASQVLVAQPMFLGLILVGCFISSSTILALAAEDEGDGPVHACMTIPWLYSVGFCITFGSLFAKILRVHKIFVSAAEMKRLTITTQETLLNIAAVLFVDIVILLVWTIIDPLYWERNVTSADKFGDPLVSVGFCTCEHWQIFAGLIAGLHFIVLSIACYLCYVTRNISEKLAESKYLAIAMVSNFQIFLVGLPVLIIIGADPHTSFFVRSVMIWMNDLMVLCLIFGHIMYNVHVKDSAGRQSPQDLVRKSMKTYIGSQVGSASRYETTSYAELTYSHVQNTTHRPNIPTTSMVDRWENEGSNSQLKSSPEPNVPNKSLLDGLRNEVDDDESTDNDIDGDSDENIQSSKGSPDSVDDATVGTARVRFAGFDEASLKNTNGTITTGVNMSDGKLPINDNSTDNRIRSLREENTQLLALLGETVLQVMESKGIGMDALLSRLETVAEAPPENSNDDDRNDGINSNGVSMAA